MKNNPTQDEKNIEKMNEINRSELWGIWALMMVTSLVTVAAYHIIFRQTQFIGTVDIAGIVKIKEEQFTAMLSRSDTTDEDRQAAYSLVRNIGPDIEKGLDVVQKKCGCTLIVKNAVLAGSANDYTDMLKTELGMTKGAHE